MYRVGGVRAALKMNEIFPFVVCTEFLTFAKNAFSWLLVEQSATLATCWNTHSVHALSHTLSLPSRFSAEPKLSPANKEWSLFGIGFWYPRQPANATKTRLG